MSSQPLSSVVSFVYNITPAGAPKQAFNMGLIVGTSTVISAGTRVKKYLSTAAMVTDGFATNSAEYLAATIYFAAQGGPQQVLIGRQATGETPLQAVTACVAANSQFYGIYHTNASNSDILAIAAYIQGLTNNPQILYVNNADAAVLANTGGNLFASLATGLYSRTFPLYEGSTAHAVCGALGFICANTLTIPGSYYTLKFKPLPTDATDVLTATQISNVQGNNGNIYVDVGGVYNYVQNGTMATGAFLDQIVFTDMLVNQAQINMMNLLTTTLSVPITEDGMTTLKGQCVIAAQLLASVGFIAPGVWTNTSLNSSSLTGSLLNGDTLDTGYRVLSQTVASQAPSDRALRKALPIFLCFKEAEAVHSSVVQLNIAS